MSFQKATLNTCYPGCSKACKNLWSLTLHLKMSPCCLEAIRRIGVLPVKHFLSNLSTDQKNPKDWYSQDGALALDSSQAFCDKRSFDTAVADIKTEFLADVNATLLFCSQGHTKSDGTGTTNVKKGASDTGTGNSLLSLVN